MCVEGEGRKKREREREREKEREGYIEKKFPLTDLTLLEHMTEEIQGEKIVEKNARKQQTQKYH